LSAKLRNVRDYLTALEKTKEERPDQVREGLEIYIDLWRRTIKSGLVAESDSVDDALQKIDERGGLYKAAGE
jgi:hypothetical protein